MRLVVVHFLESAVHFLEQKLQFVVNQSVAAGTLQGEELAVSQFEAVAQLAAAAAVPVV